MGLYEKLNKEFDTIFDSDENINFFFVCRYLKLSEELLNEIILKILTFDSEKTNFYLKLIAKHQYLTENLIEKYTNFFDWHLLDKNQCLSEKLIEKNIQKINLDLIPLHQALSEEFIERHLDKFKTDMTIISLQQKLSEEFIEKHFDIFKKYINLILRSQKLSEEFIEKHITILPLSEILSHQKISDRQNSIFKNDSLLRYKIEDNWIYKSTEEKKQAIINTNKYKCFDDYFIGYKAIRYDRYSLYNFQYKYEKGGIYESWCDCSSENYSFGLNVGTEKCAKYYLGDDLGIIVRCKVKYEDIGRIVHDGDKIRCFKIEVLD